MTNEPVQMLASGDADIAVKITDGQAPTVLWLGGFRSDMDGTKALTLADWGRANGRRVVRFDYRGHGQSGGRFEDCGISEWRADAERVVAAHGPSPMIAVGSSMGGWIALLLASEAARAGRPLAGLVLIAPAADFTERLMWPQLPQSARDEIIARGVTHIPSEYGAPYPISRHLIEDGRRHLLYGDAPIETGCPVRILQGVADADVPHTHVLELVERLATDDVVLTLVKDG
ncbi:MAG: alpha/beta hydrolase, partial [Pseudomonadota bacterium]